MPKVPHASQSQQAYRYQIPLAERAHVREWNGQLRALQHQRHGADMMTKALSFDLNAIHAKNSNGYGDV